MMKNSIITISCFAAVLLVILVLSQGLFVELNEGNDRVASLEGRVEEMDNQIEQLNSKNASLTDAIQEKDEEIASLTDAVNIKIKETTTESTTETTEESTTEYVDNDSMVFDKTKDNDDGVFDVSVADGYKDAKEELDESDVIAEEDTNYTYLGVYELTAYEYTGNCCADGSAPIEWWSVACNDPALFHKKIYIEGYGEFWVCDTGGMSSYGILDLYLGDYNSCIEFGRRSAKVWVCK